MIAPMTTAGRPRRLIRLALLTALMFIAAACGGGDDAAEPSQDDATGGAPAGESAGSEEAAPAGGGELEEVVVSMPVVPPNFVMIQPWVAQEQGFYEKFGVPVEIISLETGIAALRGAQAGSADVGAAPTPALIAAVAEGADVKGYYTYSPGLEAQMVVTEDVQSCEDLEGKVLGVDEVGGFAEVLTRAVYTSCGLTQDDVQYQSFPGAEGQAMAQGQAASGVLHIDEAENVMRQFPDANLHVLENLWETVPLWHYAAYASPQSVFDAKRDSIVAFTAGNVCATRFMQDTANKDEVVAFAAELTEVPEDIVATTYDTFVSDEIWPDDHGLPQDMIEFTGQQQVELGAIEESALPAYEDVVDLSIYEDATALVDEQGC
jgi:NitT/TauT family transport system substrate-binding protein